MIKIGSLASAPTAFDDSRSAAYRTEVLGSSDQFSWNAAIHYKPISQSAGEKASTVNVKVGSISALLKRFG